MRAVITYFAIGFELSHAAENSNAEVLPIEVAFTNFPPYSFVEGSNRVYGPIVTLTEKILKAAGIRYRISGYPLTRLKKSLANGDINLWLGINGVPNTIPSPESIISGSVGAYCLKGTQIPQSVSALEDQTIITIYGLSYSGLNFDAAKVTYHINVDEAPTHESAFRMLVAGRRLCVLDYKEPADYTIKMLDLSRMVDYSEFMKVDFFFELNANTPHAQETMKKIMNAFHTIKHDEDRIQN